MHTLLHSVPPTLQQATANPRLPWDSWTLMGKSGSVSCEVTAPFSWVLVCTRFCLCPPRVCPQSCVSSGSSVVGLIVTSKRAYATPRSTAPRPPAPAAVHCDPYLLSRHSQFCLSLCGASGPGAHQVWALWVSLAGMGFDSKWDFTPPGEGNGNPLQYYCLENPMDRGAW